MQPGRFQTLVLLQRKVADSGPGGELAIENVELMRQSLIPDQQPGASATVIAQPATSPRL